MKEIYYVYNNEAIACCIFLSILNNVKKIDIARSCLILPFLLDDRTINYLSKNIDAEFDLGQLIKEQPRLFISFNKRYLSLLPVTINSLILLSNINQIEIGSEISTKVVPRLEEYSLGDRFDKITGVIPKFLSMIENYSTDHLYKILKIQL